ncbi:hypothetical protein [Aquibium carbonis]|uniref:hypothetical protein n=1 Tax=Aquibium carbonis TaxID=2495581 RepID=UPI00147848CB|nr:hypothetical protein [Aquibium carbonis]
MKQNADDRLKRRTVLAALLALPAFALLHRVIRPTASSDIVEVDGWILKRSDVEGDRA